MPALIAALISGLAAGTAHMVWKALAALGIGFVAYNGLDLLVGSSQDKVFALVEALGPTAMSMFGVLRIGTCIKIAFSAMTMRATLFGMNAGTIRKMTT
jgi:hypothetical protein